MLCAVRLSLSVTLKKAILPLVMIGISCKTHHGFNLSQFTLNGKKHNDWIVGRYPKYGDGSPDGDLILPEMRLDMVKQSKDRLEGKLSDIDTNAPVTEATIRLVVKEITDTIVLTTNEQGKFLLKRPARVVYLEADKVGKQRRLVVYPAGREW
jgi:hypothetical protein